MSYHFYSRIIGERLLSGSCLNEVKYRDPGVVTIIKQDETNDIGLLTGREATLTSFVKCPFLVKLVGK